jgi:hypothetical protein
MKRAPVKAGSLGDRRKVDSKSRIGVYLKVAVGNLVTLLFNVIYRNFVGHISRTGCNVASGQRVSPPNLMVEGLELHQHLVRRPFLDGFE